MQKINDDELVSSSPNSVSSGYCSQWMSPNDYGFSKLSASERTLCTETECESDYGVNQMLLHEFHGIRPKKHRDWSKVLPSGVQVAKKKLTLARQQRKFVCQETEVSKDVTLGLSNRSIAHNRFAVPSSSSKLHVNGLVESLRKRYSLSSGHAVTSDKLLTSVSLLTASSLSKKHSRRPNKSHTSSCAHKIRYLIVSVCRLPAGIRSVDVKKIGNSLCWVQSCLHTWASKIGHKRTKHGVKQLQSNSDLKHLQSSSKIMLFQANSDTIQPQANTDLKQFQSNISIKQFKSNSSDIKQLQSKSFKQLEPKSNMKHIKSSNDKKKIMLIDADGQFQTKCNVKGLISKKCKGSSCQADTEEKNCRVLVEKDSCGVHSHKSASVKRKDLESYKRNAEQAERFAKKITQKPVSLIRISGLNRPLKKRSIHKQYLFNVTDTAFQSICKTHQSPLRHQVLETDFCYTEDKLDSHVSASSSIKSNWKLRDTSENFNRKNHCTCWKVKCRITGRNKCRFQQCRWRPYNSAFHQIYQHSGTLCNYVLPKRSHKRNLICCRKHQKSATNTAKAILTNETERILSAYKSPHLTDTQNMLPQHCSERRVKPDCRNLFDIFLSEIPSASQQNLSEEIISKPEMSAIQNSNMYQNNSLVSGSYDSAKDLGLLDPSDHSIQPGNENLETELFDPSARLLDTNDDMYSDISEDVLPHTVSTTYDMFSDISDFTPDEIPDTESTIGDNLPDRRRHILPKGEALWANDLRSSWLQSQCFSLPPVNLNLGFFRTNAIESNQEKGKGSLLTPEDYSGSDNHENILNSERPHSSVIQSNPPGSNSTCSTEILTDRPCSFMLDQISEGSCSTEIPINSSPQRRPCSSGEIQTLEGSCPTEIEDDSSLCIRPCSFGVTQTTVFTSDSVGPFSAEIQEGSLQHRGSGPPEERMACGRLCYIENKQRLNSPEDIQTLAGPCSNKVQDGRSPCEILSSVEMIKKPMVSTSEGCYSMENVETTLDSALCYSNAVETIGEGTFSIEVQEGTFTSCSGSMPNESAFGEHSSSEVVNKVFTCRKACLPETQKRLSVSEDIVFSQVQNELSAFDSGNTVKTTSYSERFWSSNIYKKTLTYEGPYEFGVNDEEQVPEIPCSQEGPLVSEICHVEEKHIASEADYSEEGPLVLEASCEEGSLTSEGPCSKVGPLVSEVVSEGSYSREGPLISEGPCSKKESLISEVVSEGSCSREEPLISEGPCSKSTSLISEGSCTKEGPLLSEKPCPDKTLVSEAPCLCVAHKELLIPDASYSGVAHEGSISLEIPGFDMLQAGVTGPQKPFSIVQDADLLISEVSCLSETNDVSLNLEDLLPFMLQEPSEGFDYPLNYEDLLSYEMQEGTPVESCSDNTQESHLIALTPCITTFQGVSGRAGTQKDLLTFEKPSNVDSQDIESHEVNLSQVDDSSLCIRPCSQTESFLAKFTGFTNVRRPSDITESESDGANRGVEDDENSLDESRNEWISDAKRTDFETVLFRSQLGMPHRSAKAKTESWLQEFQSQMLENQPKTHKNWKLLASVIDDPEHGRRGGRRKGASENRLRKRKGSPGMKKARCQPKRLCSMTHNSEQAESEPGEDFMVLQPDFSSVDSASQPNFSVDGVMANFQNMVHNGDPGMLSTFIDQANTWLSMENTETTIDPADLGHSGHSGVGLTTLLASDSLPSSDNLVSTAPPHSDLVDFNSVLPIQQPESSVSSVLPGLALNSVTSVDTQTMAMLSENCGNLESLNVSSVDTGLTLQTYFPGLTGVPELDGETLQYLLSMFPSSGPVGELTGISDNQSNEIVADMGINSGAIYVLNHPNCFSQLINSSQILGCNPVHECNQSESGSQRQVAGQTFTRVLIITSDNNFSNNLSAEANNLTSTRQNDSGLCTAQNSSGAMTDETNTFLSHNLSPAVSCQRDSRPDAQNDCSLVVDNELGINNTDGCFDSEQQGMIDVVESNSAPLSEKDHALMSQQQSSNTLLLEKNDERSNTSGSSSASLTENHSEDCNHQKSADVVLSVKDCSIGAVLVEKGSALNENECCETMKIKRDLVKSCCESVCPYQLQNNFSNENSHNQSVLLTDNKSVSHQSCGVEHLAVSNKQFGSASGCHTEHVDEQVASRSECSCGADLRQMSSEVPSKEDNGLSIGEDSLSDNSDPFVLTCEDEGDNAATFWEEAENNCSDVSDIILLGCNDTHQSHGENDLGTCFDVLSRPQKQCAVQEKDDASENHGVFAVVLLEGNQRSSDIHNQKSKFFEEGNQNSSEGVNQKFPEVSSEKSFEGSEILVEEFNQFKSVEEGIRYFLEDDSNKSSKEACQALPVDKTSGSCEGEVVNKVGCSNSAKFTAACDSDQSDKFRPTFSYPHGSVSVLVDKLTSKETDKVKIKLKKSEPANRAKTKFKKSRPVNRAKSKESNAVEPQGLSVVASDNIHQHRTLQSMCAVSVTESSFGRSEKQTEEHLNESGLKDTSDLCHRTVEHAEVNTCTKPAKTMEHHQNRIKLRIVKVGGGIWQAKNIADLMTQQNHSQEVESVAPASSGDCPTSLDNFSSWHDRTYISDESDDDSMDCICVDELSCPPNNRLRSPNWSNRNPVTSFLPMSVSLHRFGCTCLSCAEQQFLYGRDSTVSRFTDISIKRGLMQYSPCSLFMPANRRPLQVNNVVPVCQSPVVIDNMVGSNADMPIHIS